MNIDDIYTFIKEKLDQMYEEGNLTVEITQAEFFHIYQMVCYMRQIKHITDNV